MSDVSLEQVKRDQARPGSWLDVWARRFVFSALKQLQGARLTIEDDRGTHNFGDDSGDDHLHACMQIVDSSVYRQILFCGSIGAGEAYMRGEWTTPCLVSVVRVMARNIHLTNSLDRGWAFARRWVNKGLHLLNSNSLSGSKKNIAAHYDLGNEFFALFLDPTLMYSSAIYPNPDAPLNEAALYKLDSVCKKLDLQPSDHLLEIGTGWGGLAIFAAKHYGCKVTTTTLSQQQWLHAKTRVEAEGLEDQVTLLLSDYRELEGRYDKLVSIEMIEAVGHEYYDTYFQKCSNLLKPEGLMLIQAITISDQRYHSARHSVDFIQKYIFPGGGLPSNEVIASGIRRKTDMTISDLHDIGWDYAQTLCHWRQQFHKHLETVKAQGFDDIFCRMWDFYLAYCEGGFRERAISTVQVVMAKPRALNLPRHR